MHKASYPAILILGRDTCEDTVRSRAHLDALGVPYVYRNVEIDPEADSLNRAFNAGNRVTPTILIGDPDAPTEVLREPANEELDALIARA